LISISNFSFQNLTFIPALPNSYSYSSIVRRVLRI